ncbi:hypothetical protein F4802DRAFT_564373 [Xylaria palmicola]|nr:hypothetical protein F4802DRAFT_564373 [Xylaria palmicola]
MQARSGLLRQTRGSARPHTDPYEPNESEAESSDEDEDDDDIPASKLPVVSPSKPVPAFSAQSPAHQLKRSLSDAARGGIILYPGSKKPRNGYNMAPTPRKLLSSSIQSPIGPPAAAVQAFSRTPSLDSSSDDDIHEGLVSSVNAALHFRQSRTTQDDVESETQKPEVPASHLPNGVEAEKLEEYDIRVETPDPGSPLVAETHLAPCALPPNPVVDVPNGELESASGSAGAARDRENQAEPGVLTQVDTLSAPEHDVWDVPKSPVQPSGQEGNDSSATLGSNKPVIKRRGRPPRSSKVKTLPHSTPITKKRPVGRPRKHHLRLHSEADIDQIADITTFRKGPIPCVLDSDAQLPSQSPTVSDFINPAPPTAANEAMDHAAPRVPDGDVEERNGDFGSAGRLPQYELTRFDDDERSNPSLSGQDETASDILEEFNTDLTNSSDLDLPNEDRFKHDVDAFNDSQPYNSTDKEVFKGPSDDDILAIHLDHEPLSQLCSLLGGASWAGVRDNWQWQNFDYKGAESKPVRALLSVLARLERLYQAAPKAPDLKEQNRFLRRHADMLCHYFLKIEMIIRHIRTQQLHDLEHDEAAHNVGAHNRKGTMTRDLVLYAIPMLVHVLSSAWGLGGRTWRRTSFTGAAVGLLARALGWIMVLHRRLLKVLDRCPFEGKPESQGGKRAGHQRSEKREEIVPLLERLFQVIAAAPDQLAEAESRAKGKQGRPLSSRDTGNRAGPSTTGSRVSPPPALRPAEWSMEEQRLVFLRIQASFPICPDLDNLRWEVGKTVEQTAAMTEHILAKMLAKVLIGYSKEEQAAKVREVMLTSPMVGP